MFHLLKPLALALAFATTALHANQSISDGELQRFTYSGRFPLGCQEATLAANGLRAKPSSDPARLHEAARVFHACAVGPYGVGSDRLRNQANFSAAAALLLAARYDQPVTAVRDATDAKTLAQAIVDFRRPRSVQTPGLNNDPSAFRTDAGRIVRDATALLGPISAASPS